jgi:acetyltransferase-like isoleucine patch superfamily enzyme
MHIKLITFDCMNLMKRYWEGLASHIEWANQTRLRNRMNNLVKWGTVEWGAHSYGIPEFFIDRHSNAKVIIGKFCSISEGVKIFNGDNHHTRWISPFPFQKKWNPANDAGHGHPFNKGNIVIGNDVWIGYGAVVLSGAKIGDGCIITAGAVVAGEVEAYSMAGGVPAKMIRKRFSDEAIKKLLSLQWWNWPEDKIREAAPLLNSENITAFLEKYA